MRRTLIFTLPLLFSSAVAQEDENDWRLYKSPEERVTVQKIDTTTPGSLIIRKAPEIDTLIERLSIADEGEVKIEGFTVQIAISQKSADVNRMQAEFLRKYPDVPTKIDYKQPNFRLRVGRFYDRLSAERFLKELSGTYSGGLVIKDMIELPPIPEKKSLPESE